MFIGYKDIAVGESVINKIYRGEEVVYQKEEPEIDDFNLLINSGTDARISIPTSGQLNLKYGTYNWNIDWGDGQVTNHSGTGTVSSVITHYYSKPNTEYRIIIKPTNPNELGWLKAFGQAGSGSLLANRVKFLEVGGKLTERMIRVSSADRYVLYGTFSNLPNLKMSKNFCLPDLSIIGENFANATFMGCSSIELNEVFQIPLKLNSFVKECFKQLCVNCRSIKSCKNFFGGRVLPQSEINKTEALKYTFQNCTGIIEEISPSTIPQLSVIPTTRNFCFSGVNPNVLINCHANWQ